MYDDYDGYLEDDDTHGYPLCPYDGRICALNCGCNNCEIRKFYERNIDI